MLKPTAKGNVTYLVIFALSTRVKWASKRPKMHLVSTASIFPLKWRYILVWAHSRPSTLKTMRGLTKRRNELRPKKTKCAQINKILFSKWSMLYQKAELTNKRCKLLKKNELFSKVSTVRHNQGINICYIII